MKLKKYIKPAITVKKIDIPFFFSTFSLDEPGAYLAQCMQTCGSVSSWCCKGGSCKTTGPPSDTSC